MTSDADGAELDAALRRRIDEVATRMGAQRSDLPDFGVVRDDGYPSCWRDADGGRHVTSRERGTVLVDRVTSDPDEYLAMVAETIAELRANRLVPPGSEDYRRRSWQEMYTSLAQANPDWAQSWLAQTRAALIARGAGAELLEKLPGGR